MRFYPIKDSTRDNPIVMDQTALLYDAIQEEVCGEIESTLGSLTNQPQLLKAILTTRVKYLTFFGAPLYGGPKVALEANHQLDLPDPISVFAGFFDLYLYKIPALLHQSEVFFYYDFSLSNWIFKMSEGCLLKLSYSQQTSTLTLEDCGLLKPITPWHIIQMRNLRMMRR